MTRFRHAIVVTVLTLVGAVGLYFLFDIMFRRPVAASAEAGPIENLFQAHFVAMAVLFSFIMVFMLYAVFVFRRKDGDETDGPHIHGNTGLEIAWTILPTIIVVGFGVYGTVILNDITAPNQNEMPVTVIGRQWNWSFQYPELENRGSAELVLPVDRPVLINLESEDVLHSFWVPEFRVKQDLVPGYPQVLRLTPTMEGNYRLICAEICGLEHANMRADVRVVSQAEFEQWSADLLAKPLPSELSQAERGEFWYSAEGFGCNACHSLDGSQMSGPTWQGIVGREEEMADGTTVVADEAYLRESILNPDAKIVAGYDSNLMPENYAEQFAAREQELLLAENFETDIVEDLIAFMMTLEAEE